MKQVVAALLALILINIGSIFGFQGSTDWIKYESPAGRYSVLLPAQPKPSTQEAATGSGEKFPQYMVSTSDRDAVYLVLVAVRDAS